MTCTLVRYNHGKQKGTDIHRNQQSVNTIIPIMYLRLLIMVLGMEGDFAKNVISIIGGDTLY